MTDFNQSPKLQLLPAIDVADGKAVRLTQGKAGTETSFGSPVDAAEDWVQQGAEWIHLVDLDAAFGRGDNRAVIKKVIKAVKGRVQVELSGGIRDEASLEAAGCSRYVVTAVTKDGTLKGPHLELQKQVAQRTEKPVVASGGVSSLDDIAALRELVPHGVEGAIVGKALYAGAFTLVAALDVAGQ